MTDERNTGGSPLDSTPHTGSDGDAEWPFVADENFGGVLFDSIARFARARKADQALRTRLLHAARRKSPIEQFVSRVALILDIPRKAAEQAIERLDDEDSWKPTKLPGVYLMEVRGGSELEGCMTTFVRIEPGNGFPVHEHLGDELLLLVRGSCVDSERNERLEAGDLHISYPGSSHGSQVNADEEEPLIYLAVIRGSLRIGDRVIDF